MTGTYTQIVEIVAPSEAAVGEVVSVEVKVKNLFSSDNNITVTGRAGDTELHFGSIYHTVPVGATQSFYDSFIMPSGAVTLTVWSFYWTGTEWYQDDEASKAIPLIGVFAGTISQKKLEYNGTHASIPVHNIPQGKRGLVHIWGRNDTASFQSLGIGWVVTDPDGTVVETHENDWAFGLVGSGQDREFIGGRFDLNKVGTYRIGIILYENSSDPVEVDGYEGELCKVIAVVEMETLEVDITPVGAGHVTTSPASQEGRTTWHNGDTGTFFYGTSVQVTAHPAGGYVFEKWSDEIVGGVSYQNPEYVKDMTEHRAVKAHFGGEPVPGKGELTAIVVHWQEYTDLIPPAAIEARGTYEIHPVAVNVGEEAIQFRVEATVIKPSGAEVAVTDIDGWPYTGAGKEFKPTLNMGNVDEVGTWAAVINLYNHETNELLDSWSGDILITTAAAVSIFESIMPLLVLGLLAGIMIPMMKENSE